MAKGEQKGNRETKKPKKEKIKVIAAAPSQKAGAGLAADLGFRQEEIMFDAPSRGGPHFPPRARIVYRGLLTRAHRRSLTASGSDQPHLGAPGIGGLDAVLDRCGRRARLLQAQRLAWEFPPLRRPAKTSPGPVASSRGPAPALCQTLIPR